MFLIESTDMSDHNSDEPEEDPECQNVVCILFCYNYVGISLFSAHILTFSNRPTISFV